MGGGRKQPTESDSLTEGKKNNQKGKKKELSVTKEMNWGTPCKERKLAECEVRTDAERKRKDQRKKKK